MHDHIETMLNDLYTLDPSLRERDTDVRNIVHALITHKPAVTIDSVFVTDLRRTLLTTPRSIPSPWYTWFAHAAPVGVVALIMLMIVPAFTGPVHVPQDVPLADSFATEAPVMMEAKNIADTSDPESTTRMLIMSDSVPSDSFTLAPQPAGDTVSIDYATLTTPGFITVNRVNGDGTIGERLGMSVLLTQGTTEAFTVPLTVSMVVGDTFYAVLYPDNGDGVLTDDDTMHYTADGTYPMYTLFSVESLESPDLHVE